MESVSKEQSFLENLYEIPSCVICLQGLVEGMGSLDCGHVFHIACIKQHLKYSRNCPNCKKQAQSKEINPVYFPLTFYSKARDQLHRILNAFDGEEQKQVQHMLREVNLMAIKVDQLKLSLGESEKKVEELQKDLKNAQQKLENLKKENIQLKNVLVQSNSSRNKAKNYLRMRLKQWIKSQTEYEQLKECRRMAMYNSQEVIKLKQEMQLADKPNEEMAQVFFDMLLLKNLEIIKLKNQHQDYITKIHDRNFEIFSLIENIDSLTKKNKDLSKQKDFYLEKFKAKDVDCKCTRTKFLANGKKHVQKTSLQQSSVKSGLKPQEKKRQSNNDEHLPDY